MWLATLKRAGLLVASFVLTSAVLGGGELLLRWARPEALLTSRVYREHIYSQVYGWAPRPRSRGEWPNGTSFSVNGSGYRGKALGDRRDGVRRVLILGDSIAFGAGANDSETFAERLQGFGSGLEVTNLAVSGYGTDQEMLRLEREGFDLDPDAVVLNLCLSNDYVDNMLDSYLHDEGTPKPHYVVSEDRLQLRNEHLRRTWAAQMGLRLQERSHLFNALLLLVDPAARADDSPPPPPEHWVSRQNRILADFEPVADLTRRLIARTARLCRERGVDFVVLLHPDRESYEGEDGRVAALEGGQEGLAGVRLVDLRRRYRAAGLDFERIAFDDIGHLTPTGHSFVAEILRGELR